MSMTTTTSGGGAGAEGVLLVEVVQCASNMVFLSLVFFVSLAIAKGTKSTNNNKAQQDGTTWLIAATQQLMLNLYNLYKINML